MNNSEALEHLKDRVNCAKYIDADHVDRVDIQAINIAIKALTKEAKIEERKAKVKAEREKIERSAILYSDLKEGDLFRITSVLSDKRIFRKDYNGSTQIKDANGNSCDYKSYPYLTMAVYKMR